MLLLSEKRIILFFAEIYKSALIELRLNPHVDILIKNVTFMERQMVDLIN